MSWPFTASAAPAREPGAQPAEAAAQAFRAVFGAPPEVQAAAPGRVNLLGEHTDYNEGFVLPVAIPQQTQVAIRRASGSGFRLHAQDLAQTVSFTVDQTPQAQFARYVMGCLCELQQALGAGEPPLPAMDLLVASEVPMGVGLSSSAALEVATLRALRLLLGLLLDDVQIAQLAQQAEVRHAGVRCGILDQMASSLADTRHALLLDTRSLDRRLVPLPAGTEILVLDSGLSRNLASSGYNQRRAECEEAAHRLGVASLRDVTDPAAAEALPEPLNRRVRHVLSENARVLAAVACENAAAFGALMKASHASLRDDYAVSVPALDQLVDLLQRHPRVHGARLTGAGFGGACVALCQAGHLPQVAQEVLAAYAARGGRGRPLVPPGLPLSGLAGLAEPD